MQDMFTCQGCGLHYETADDARYCARTDADPRGENERLRLGTQRRIVLPIEWKRDDCA